MRLDELTFRRDANGNWEFTTIEVHGSGVFVYRAARQGLLPWASEGNYAVQKPGTNHNNVENWWKDLDPIAAQAILYHLLGETDAA